MAALIDHCTVRDNDARGIYDVGSADAPARVTHNTVRGNTIWELDGAGIYAAHALVSDNTVEENAVSGGLFGSCGGIYASYSEVSHNIARRNRAAGLYGGDGGGICALDSVVSQNTVSYVPYLQEPSPGVPLLPPTGLTADFQDGSVALSWDVHPHFTTGWGYRVYYDRDTALPPYQGRGLSEGDSPVDVGGLTHYTLTGLDANVPALSIANGFAPRLDIYLAVTVYDDGDRESWYSNVVWRPGSGYRAYLPAVSEATPRND